MLIPTYSEVGSAGGTVIVTRSKAFMMSLGRRGSPMMFSRSMQGFRVMKKPTTATEAITMMNFIES